MLIGHINVHTVLLVVDAVAMLPIDRSVAVQIQTGELLIVLKAHIVRPPLTVLHTVPLHVLSEIAAHYVLLLLG